MTARFSERFGLLLVLALGCGGGAGAVMDAGVDRVHLGAQESHYCSTSPDEDPLHVCTPAQELVCINTYDVQSTEPEVRVRYDGGVRPVYVCRFACEKPQDCIQPGDVCCLGSIYGPTHGKRAACVPAGLCQTAPRDGGS